MIRRSMKIAILSSIGTGMLGCSAAPDSQVDSEAREEESEVGSTRESLLGDAVFPSCSSAAAAFGQSVLNSARFAAVSKGFAACIDQTMRFGAMDHGPYRACPLEPYSSSSITTQVQRAQFAARSTNNLSVTCHDMDLAGRAEHGYYSFQGTEEMQISNLDDLAALNNTLARSATAGVIWHEAMHQHGYRHDCSRPLSQSVPYIVGNCMQRILAMTATECIGLCGPGKTAIHNFAGACECVDDPENDVGVIMDTGQTCPVPPGRYFSEEVTMYMDDEDDNNANARGGWIGRFTSNSNTTLRFCRVPGNRFWRPAMGPVANGSRNYGVLRMGATCPNGSVEFARNFDNEDDSNENFFVGHVRPSSSWINTQLEFCLFREQSGGTTAPFPNLSGMRYGVFAGTQLPWQLATGWVYTDDEDDGNINNVSGSWSGSATFLTTGPNTTLRLARVF